MRDSQKITSQSLFFEVKHEVVSVKYLVLKRLKFGIAAGIKHTPSVHLATIAPFHSPDMVTKGFLSGCKISAVIRFFLPP